MYLIQISGLGSNVPWSLEAIGRALKKDRNAIAGYARSQSWEKVAERLREVLARENPEGGNEIPIEFTGSSIQ